jgi:putative ABC transport system substrate-binding protein
VERRTGEDSDQLVDSARELVAHKVDLLLVGGNRAAIAAKRATTTIPIVMDLVLTPVQSGLIESLARPGGNVTGVTTAQRPPERSSRFCVMRCLPLGTSQFFGSRTFRAWLLTRRMWMTQVGH